MQKASGEDHQMSKIQLNFEINFGNLANGKGSYEFDPEVGILEVKTLLLDKTKIKESALTLKYGETKLEDAKKLSDYPIPNRSTITGAIPFDQLTLQYLGLKEGDYVGMNIKIKGG